MISKILHYKIYIKPEEKIITMNSSNPSNSLGLSLY